MEKIIKYFKVVDSLYYFRDKLINESYNSQGYSRLNIEGKAYRTHRLIAFKYIDNPKKLNIVDHIDGDKKNYSLQNLRWVTSSENSKSA